MVSLTVGYVSGIIAAGVFLLRLLLPTSSAFVLVGLVKENQSAASWTAVASTLQASYWSNILRADSTASDGRKGVVIWECLWRVSAMGALSIASIVTPLGLYEAVVAGPTVSQPFQYAPDTSPMGIGTPPRSSLGFSRRCYSDSCSIFDTLVERREDTNETGVDGYNIAIPQKAIDIFQSGLVNLPPTVSSIWDIQWRGYSFETNNNNSAPENYLVPQYRQLEMLALNNKVEPVEGLIVDTINGGVGLRNHSLPPWFPDGSSWSEDLLFIEPQTACVPMNLSIDFHLVNGAVSGDMKPKGLTLVDKGGFAQFDTEYAHTIDISTGQDELDLQARAFTAAWISNALTMYFLNVSNPRQDDFPRAYMYLNSTLDKQFPLQPGLDSVGYNSFIATDSWGSFLNLKTSPNSSLDGGLKNSTESPYPNPFNITNLNFTDAGLLCEKQAGMDLANISSVGVQCGMVYGAAHRTDGGSPALSEPGSRWSTPLYSCASATRAMLKTVDLRYNGSDALGSLAVDRIMEKTYDRKEDQPLWGAENTKLPLRIIQPIWGLVSPEYQGRDDINVIQKPFLWLPGYKNNEHWPLSRLENLPGTQFHTDILSATYELDTSQTPVADYTGKSNLGMYIKWQEYSKSPATASKIINLVWTDMAANAIVGARGWHSDPVSGTGENSKRNLGKRQSGEGAAVPVSIYEKKIQYRLPFGIPAIVVLVLTLALAIAATVLWATGRATVATMRKYLNHTSLGRAMTLFLYPGQCESQASTQKWMSLVGTRWIDLSGPAPSPGDSTMMTNSYATESGNPLLPKTH